MMREDCWCFENEEYAAGVLAGKVIMWRLCAGVFRKKGCEAKSSVCLKWVNVVIGVFVFAGIGFVIRGITVSVVFPGWKVLRWEMPPNGEMVL